MDSIAIAVTSAPYGVEGTLGSLYLSFPILAKKMQLDVLLSGDGVFCAMKEQMPEAIEHPAISELLQNAILLGGKVYVEKESCKKRGVKEAELLQGVEVVEREKISQVLVGADGNIVF